MARTITKQVLFAGLALICGIQTAAVAQADVDYRPVQIFDGNLVQRLDLAGRPEDLQTPIPADRLLKEEDISRRLYGSVEVSLFTDVARFIQALKEGRHLEFEPTSALTPPSCTQNAAFNLNQLPQGKSSAACKIRTVLYENARKAGWENSCAEVELPEAYVTRRPPGLVQSSDLDNLEGLIATLGEPLSKLDLPPALRGPSLINEMRIILRKVRLTSLRQQLNARQSQLESLIDGLKNQADCFDGLQSHNNSMLARLRAIRAENAQMLGFLDQLESEGRALAEQDRAKVQQANGRKRAELPLPWMTDRERELLSMALGGFY